MGRRNLNVSDCSELKGLPSRETLVSLEELWAEGCVKLKNIRGLELAALQQSFRSKCQDLEKLVYLKALWTVGGLMCEAEDHKGFGAGDKAFDAKMLMGAMD